MGVGFSGSIRGWRGPAPHHVVTVPPGQSAQLAEVAAEVTYGRGWSRFADGPGTPEVERALWPEDGGCVVPLGDAVRRAEQLDVGDVVPLRLEVRRRG